MPRLGTEYVNLAREIIDRYPVARSALIPLLHLAQEQDGYVSEEAMTHIAEMLDITPAEVLGTCSFYEMFKREPVGEYLVNVCTNIACMLSGGEELLEHLEERLAIKAGSTTVDGRFTLEDVECIAACTEAPCLQVNYRYFHRISNEQVDALLEDLNAGRLAHEVPKHGTLARVRQQIAADRRARVARPDQNIEPVWLARNERAERGMSPIAAEIPRIISARWDLDDGFTLDRYEATGGYQALKRALQDMTPAQVHEEVKAASLLGRGGAGFPAGIKWGFCPPGVFPRYLVVNGDESEPGTYKDRILMERDPHQLVEGVLLAAYAIGCSQAFLYVRGEMALAQERLASALNDAYAQGYVGRNILGSEFSLDVVLHWGAGAYIVGEETALIESLEGNRGLPRLKPPYFPAAKGLYLQPTVVNNVETLSNLPWIIANGGGAFADLGAEKSTGTRLFAVSGHVQNPGVFEVEFGTTTFRDLLYGHQYGGGIRDGKALKAFIPGGASAPWFYEEHLDLPLEAGAVGAAGSMLGSGAIVVMDETTDAVKACWRVVRFFARESCGKCTPCREGTSWLEKILRRMLDGRGRPSDVDKLMDICDNISPEINWPPKQTTICPLGPSVVSPIASAVVRFRDEFEKLCGSSVAVTALGEAASPPPTALSKRAYSVNEPGGAADWLPVKVMGKAYLSRPVTAEASS